jgi:hypothetical protein
VIATWLPSSRGMQHDDQVGPVPSLAALVVPPQDARSGRSVRLLSEVGTNTYAIGVVQAYGGVGPSLMSISSLDRRKPVPSHGIWGDVNGSNETHERLPIRLGVADRLRNRTATQERNRLSQPRPGLRPT